MISAVGGETTPAAPAVGTGEGCADPASEIVGALTPLGVVV